MSHFLKHSGSTNGVLKNNAALSHYDSKIEHASIIALVDLRNFCSEQGDQLYNLAN